MKPGPRGGDAKGRWPANVILDEEAGKQLDAQSGVRKSGKPCGVKAGGKLNVYGHYSGGIPVTGYGDEGGASRFFYCAKASQKERNAYGAVKNFHATVKPLDLMKYLVRLVVPADGLVLDPFLGSGTTAVACEQLGHSWVGIERDAEHAELATQRIKAFLR